MKNTIDPRIVARNLKALTYFPNMIAKFVRDTSRDRFNSFKDDVVISFDGENMQVKVLYDSRDYSQINLIVKSMIANELSYELISKILDISIREIEEIGRV